MAFLKAPSHGAAYLTKMTQDNYTTG